MKSPLSPVPDSALTLSIQRLVLTNFRCYAHMEMALDGRPVVLTGPNGAGKTNILESISLLGPGRGLRSARMTDLGRRATSFPGKDDPPHPWAVSADISNHTHQFRVGTGVHPTVPGRRAIRIDGQAAKSAAELAGILRIVWLTPAMDRMFMEGASVRRRFFDRLVLGLDNAHGTRVNQYERAMRERNALLREGRFDDAWLSGLELTMAEHGIAIAASRKETLDRLQPYLIADSAFPNADVRLEGMLEKAIGEQAAVDIEHTFAQSLKDSRRRDAAASRTLEGPHSTDMIVIHGDKNSIASECSTGEQKALLIRLVLGHAQLLSHLKEAAPPILLLDEIAAHLDEQRRSALFDELLELGIQAWMTGTDTTMFKGLAERAQWYSVTAEHGINQSH